MAGKGKQPKKELSTIERFRLGEIKKFTVPIFGEAIKPVKKRGRRKSGYKGHIRWLSHNEMLMHHKRIKRRRRRNEIAKRSRCQNRAA